MTRRDRHATTEEMLTWLDAGRPEDDPTARHVAACEECAGLASALGELRKAARSRSWTLPPESVRRGAMTRRGAPAPRLRRATRADWTPADVRGSASLAAGQPRSLTGAIPGLRVGLLVTPRPGERRWEVRGKIWLAGGGEVRLFLVHDDHVIAEAALRESGEFRFDEPLPPGWSLEVHPARGAPLVIADPEAEPS
jgi:hypothetical protein